MSRRQPAPRESPPRRLSDAPSVVLPPLLAWGIVFVCVLPSLLILLGVDLGTPLGRRVLLEASGERILPFGMVRGSILHTLMEWTAVCVAGMTAFLALLHYRNTSNPITPVLFVALSVSACADVAHILLSGDAFAPGIVGGPVVPFSWAVSRLYFASILVMGVAYRLLQDHDGNGRPASPGKMLRLLSMGGAMAVVGILLMVLGAEFGDHLELAFADAQVTHPLDLVPLGLLLVGATVLFPKLHRAAPSLFSHSLLLTSLPAVATQIHMAFGSRELFDSHFNAAHVLKLVTYLVPLLGLAFDYARTYEQNVVARVRLENEIRLRQDMQDRLWSTEAVNEAILASVGDAIVTVDDRGRIELFNPAAETMFEVEAARMVGLPATALAADQWRPALEGLVDRSSAPEDLDLLSTHFEMVGRRSDGADFPMDLTISEFEVEGLVRCALVLRDMTAQRRASKELADQASVLRIRTEDLSRSNDELEKFAYVASHDLQEPLRMVYSFTDVLAEHLGPTLDDEARSYMGFIQDGVERMRALIGDLLRFSRVGAPQGDYPSIQLDEAVRRAIDNLQAAIAEAEATLQIDALRSVRGDLTEVTQVFQNLISNALKFRGDAPPFVHIQAERRGPMVCVTIRDNGIGLDMQYSEKIFVLFQRLHTRDRYPGTGIGLALCRKIVERYGGTIEVESTPGEGAVFRFTLPVG